MKHGAPVAGVAFSADGSRVVTASEDETGRVWDAATGQPVTKPLGHTGSVSSAVFSPDGTRVVTASFDGAVRLWDAARGELIGQIFKHDIPVLAAAFSRDGARLLTRAIDGVRVWDIASGRTIFPPLRHEILIMAASFDPGGTRIVTASGDKTVRVWNAVTGGQTIEPLWHPAAVQDARFSPDGSRIVTAPWDGARVWDGSSGVLLAGPFVHGRETRAAAFSPDGARLLTRSGSFAEVWDLDLNEGPAPAALAELAEGVGGFHLDEQSIAAPAANRAATLVRRAAAPGSEDSWTRWFLADRTRRSISPVGALTVPEYARRLVATNTPESLAHAADLQPANPPAVAAIPAEPPFRPVTSVAEEDKARARRVEKRKLSVAMTAGGLKKGMGDARGALADYANALPIAEKLAHDTGDLDAQADLIHVHLATDEAHLALFDPRSALASATEALAICERLAAAQPEQPRIRSMLATTLGAVAAVQLYNRQPAAAITSATRALALDSEQLWINLNLADALLLTGQYAEAERLFLQHKDAKLAGDKIFGELALKSFIDLKKNGIDHPDMERIRPLLAPPKSK